MNILVIMKALNIISAVLSSLLVSSAWAYIPGERIAPSFHVGTYDMVYYGEYFSSDSNIGETYGDVDSLAFDNSYAEFTNRFEGGYTFALPARAFAATRFTYVKTESAFNIPESKNATEFNTLAAGGQYFFKTKRLLIIPEFLYEHSLEDVDINQNEPVASDGVSAIQAGAFIASYMWKFKSEAYIGYRYHTEDLADLLLWSWRLALRYPEWSITGAVAGAVPVSDDVDKDGFPGELQRQQLLSRVNGGSSRHHAINPQWIDASVEGAYRIDPKMKAIIGAKHTLTGRNTAFGWSVLVGFTAEFGESKAADATIPGSEFQPQLEDYDKSIFQ